MREDQHHVALVGPGVVAVVDEHGLAVLDDHGACQWVAAKGLLPRPEFVVVFYYAMFELPDQHVVEGTVAAHGLECFIICRGLLRPDDLDLLRHRVLADLQLHLRPLLLCILSRNIRAARVPPHFVCSRCGALLLHDRCFCCCRTVRIRAFPVDFSRATNVAEACNF